MARTAKQANNGKETKTTAKVNTTAKVDAKQEKTTTRVKNNTPVMVVKNDKWAEKATAKAVDKVNKQRANNTWRGFVVSTSIRVDALKSGILLDECVNNIINILNRVDKGKAPETAQTLATANVTVATAKAAAKAVDKTVYAKYINSRGIFDAQRALGALVASVCKEREKAAKKRNAQKNK